MLSHSPFFLLLHAVLLIRSCSFTLKNEGEVSFDYSWCLQPGTYRPPSPQAEGSKAGGAGKSARSKAGSSQGGKQSSLASRQSGTKAKQQDHQQRRPRAGTLDGRSSTATDAAPNNAAGRAPSQLAHSVDGRPASAMTTAFDACSANDPASGVCFLKLFVQENLACDTLT